MGKASKINADGGHSPPYSLAVRHFIKRRFAASQERRRTMAISEACQMWIEQRIEEELQEQEETGKSLRSIGREIAKEIERVFEAKVNPETLRSRARILKSGLNHPPQATPQEHTESEENGRDAKGRFIDGSKEAGRKPKYGKEEEEMQVKITIVGEEVIEHGPLEEGYGAITDRKLTAAFKTLEEALLKAKKRKWKNAPRITVQKRLQKLHRLILEA